MTRQPELFFDFVARYEVSVLDRIDRLPDFQHVLSFPDAVPVDSQREHSRGVILAVRPADGEPWIGVFDAAEYSSPPAASRRVIGWPDERSICVVLGGNAIVVRTDDPKQTHEIDCFPVCDVLVVPDHELVVFGDDISLVAYGRDGLVWSSGRLAWDEVQILDAGGDTLRVSGFDPTSSSGSHPVFSVDLRTGASSDKPYPDD